MKVLWNVNQLTFATIGGFIGWFWGGCDGLIYALITFVVIDYITGVMCAIVSKNLSSEIGFKGLFRKVLIFMLVGIANVIDMQIIGAGSALRVAVIFFYLSNEGISILENAAFLGVPIPDELKKVLKQIKNHDKNKRGKK
ncbi:MAG: phage holin family protein [Clostridia bacterium]|nr:phage holin family protein [Clostridia bacterium]MEE3451431.1 phage holin family protein [Acutalibacteraceae bacterium]